MRDPLVHALLKLMIARVSNAQPGQSLILETEADAKEFLKGQWNERPELDARAAFSQWAYVLAVELWRQLRATYGDNKERSQALTDIDEALASATGRLPGVEFLKTLTVTIPHRNEHRAWRLYYSRPWATLGDWKFEGGIDENSPQGLHISPAEEFAETAFDDAYWELALERIS
jgi:hypothetical protein